MTSRDVDFLERDSLDRPLSDVSSITYHYFLTQMKGENSLPSEAGSELATSNSLTVDCRVLSSATDYSLHGGL